MSAIVIAFVILLLKHPWYSIAYANYHVSRLRSGV